MPDKAKIFRALGDEERLRIISLLLTKYALCVCEIVHALKVPQYRVSKHLLHLKNVGLVEVKKEGRWGYYYLKTENRTNRSLFAFLKNYLPDGISQRDKKALAHRLLLREKGKCVVGFVPEKKLLRLIKQKRYPKHSKSPF
jgi:ArsR family transcriptional regulator